MKNEQWKRGSAPALFSARLFLAADTFALTIHFTILSAGLPAK
jgi:hypothetical protein